MLSTCSVCSMSFRSHTQRDSCKQCASVCSCGNAKDYRANKCRPCTSKEQALLQWSTPDKKSSILSGIRAAGIIRRTTYNDLCEQSFSFVKKDGRRFASYWKTNGKLGYVYRYRWIWEQANGLIPDGKEIHHKNGDCTDDRLDNLEPIEGKAHRTLHMTTEHKIKMLAGTGREYAGRPTWTCLQCHKEFSAYRRGDKGRKYCSLDCRNQAYRA